MKSVGLAACFVAVLFLPLTAGAARSAASRSAARAAVAAGPIDADTLPKGSADAVTTFRWLDSGKYQLEVQNTSGIGFLNTFSWVPPPGLTITAVTSSEGARCSLQNGDIYCSGKITPPQCTCQPGGFMTVNFTATGDTPTYANGYWTYYGIVGGYLHIQTVTPVPYHIPSFSSSPFQDLPLCKGGQTSTKSKPCAPVG
jgi:hypothetical protein